MRKCEQCLYYPHCDEYPFDESGCDDFKNQSNFVEVVSSYNPGDVCFYGYGNGNKPLALIEIVKLCNDPRGIAEVKFLKVFVDDTGNGMFNYFLRSGKTMNASLRYLRNITPVYGENGRGES